MTHDIVYFVREGRKNEELRYSLRSVEKNFAHNKVWLYGGCPDGIRPDHHVKVLQDQPTKWQNVRMMLEMACNNDEISEDFWLFNDDFFVLKPTDKEINYYDGDLYRRIVKVEGRHNNTASSYTLRLRKTVQDLEDRGLGALNYAVHLPMLVNRKKALEVLQAFSDNPMFRALYGNYWKIGGENHADVKIAKTNIEVKPDMDYLSSQDSSFANGKVGEYIRKEFAEPSRWEVKNETTQ